jgi:DNA helicase-2/ATP-dependent DNA helicase PcrA
MANRDDDASFERVINTPTRGIGAKALDDIRSIARDQDLSLWAATIVLINQRTMTARATNALIGFLELIKHLAKEAEELTLDEKVKLVVEKSGLMAMYQK